jgi:hypothetical protein
MGIKKYTTFEDAERDLWRTSSGRNSLKEVFTIFHLKQFKKVFKCPRGIFKYKTIQDAEIDAEKWLREFYTNGNR